MRVQLGSFLVVLRPKWPECLATSQLRRFAPCTRPSPVAILYGAAWPCEPTRLLKYDQIFTTEAPLDAGTYTTRSTLTSLEISRNAEVLTTGTCLMARARVVFFLCFLAEDA